MNKMSESKAMREIHEIREKHYEETKNMTNEEYIASIRKGAKKAIERIKQIRKSKSKVG
jgi:hypothetical protein